MTVIDVERASEALDALSRALVAVDVSTLGAGFASGASGLALAHAYLHPRYPARGHADAAQKALRHASLVVQRSAVDPWMAGGLAGVGWVMEHVTREPSPPVDHALARLLSQPGLPWEVLYGVAGLTAYGIEGLHRPAARDLLTSVARALIAAYGDGPSWLSRPEWDQVHEHAGPYTSFGFAHGFPGALAACAALGHHGVAADDLRPILVRASAWLMRQRLPGGSFRSWSDDEGSAARTAWCYGDPGVAWSLMRVARATHDLVLEDEALAIAARAAATPSGIVDAGLCHGAAGLAHLYHRMHLLRPDREDLAGAARLYFDRTLDMRAAGAPLEFRAFLPDGRGAFAWVDDPGVLNGAAGVALAIASALDPRAVGWDLPLLLG